MSAVHIALHGKMESGKNYTADAISELVNELTGGKVPVAQYAFATKLKVSGMKSLGFDGPDEDLVQMANEIKERGTVQVKLANKVVKKITGREFWQFTGTEGGREIHGKDVWVNLAMAQVVPTGVAVFTDCRFPNEATSTRATDGGVVWHVVGPEDDTGDHPSEQVLPPELIDFTIDNTVRDDNGERLKEQLRKLIIDHPLIPTE